MPTVPGWWLPVVMPPSGRHGPRTLNLFIGMRRDTLLLDRPYMLDQD